MRTSSGRLATLASIGTYLLTRSHARAAVVALIFLTGKRQGAILKKICPNNRAHNRFTNIWTCNECGAEAVNAPPLSKLKKYDKVIVISEEGDHLLPIGTRGVVVNDAYSEGVHIVTTDNGSVVAILEEALQLQSSNDVPTGMLTFITGELAKIYCKLDELAVRVKILEEGKPLSAVLGDLVKGTRQR